MEDNNKICYIGKHLKEDCSFTHYATNSEVHKLQELAKDDMKILFMRTSIDIESYEDSDNEVKDICSHHFAKYLKYYSNNQRICTDPWKRHTSGCTNRLKEVDLDLSQDCKTVLSLIVCPGQKLCQRCSDDITSKISSYKQQFTYCCDPFEKHRVRITSELNLLETNHITYLVDVYGLKLTVEHKVCSACKIKLEAEIIERCNIEDKSEQGEPADKNVQMSELSTPETIYESDSQNKRKLDEVLNTFNMSPFKRAKLTDERAMKKGVQIVQKVNDRFTEVFEKACNIKLPSINMDKALKESAWFREMMSSIKQKINLCETSQEKITVLSILPESMSLRDISEYFQCSYYVFHEARKAKQNLGKNKQFQFNYCLYLI